MWSFAILLWELATRAVPFADLSAMEIGMKVNLIFFIVLRNYSLLWFHVGNNIILCHTSSAWLLIKARIEWVGQIIIRKAKTVFRRNKILFKYKLKCDNINIIRSYFYNISCDWLGANSVGSILMVCEKK